MKNILIFLLTLLCLTAVAESPCVPADGVMIGSHGYQQLGEFIGDYAAVQDESGLWGVIDRHNRLLVPCRYEALENAYIGVFRTPEGEELDAGAVARRWPANCVIVDVDPATTVHSPSDEGEWVIAATWRPTAAYPAKVEPVTANRAQTLAITPRHEDSRLRCAVIAAWPNETAAGAYAAMSSHVPDEVGRTMIAGLDAYCHYDDTRGTLTLYIDTERSAVLTVCLCLPDGARPGVAALLSEAEQLLGGLVLPLGAAHRFENVWFCDEDYILVQRDGLWGLLDFDGQTILECEWEALSEPWRGLIGAKRDGRWGGLSLDGRVVIPFEWDAVDPTVDWRPGSGGVSVMVERDGRQGRLAADGSVLVSCEYEHVGQIGEEPWPYYVDTEEYRTHRRYFVLTDSGMEERAEADFRWSWDSAVRWQPPEGYEWQRQSMPEGLYLLRRLADGKLVLAREDGTPVDETGFDEVDHFIWSAEGTEAYMLVRRGDKWGYADQTGVLVIPCRYDGAKEMHEGRAAVRVGSPEDGERFWIDQAGNRLYDYPWDAASVYHRGVALVKQGGLWGMIDREGNMLAECRWEFVLDNTGMATFYPFSGAEIMAVATDGLMGFMNVKGEMVTPCRFGVESFRQGYPPNVLRNAAVRGDRALVWDQGELLIFSADGTRLY